MRFADTNVLLYSVSTVLAEAAKAGKAQALLANRDIALSVQVLQEFYVQATRASRAEPLTHEEVMGFIRTWSVCAFFEKGTKRTVRGKKREIGFDRKRGVASLRARFFGKRAQKSLLLPLPWHWFGTGVFALLPSRHGVKPKLFFAYA